MLPEFSKAAEDLSLLFTSKVSNGLRRRVREIKKPASLRSCFTSKAPLIKIVSLIISASQWEFLQFLMWYKTYQLRRD